MLLKNKKIVIIGGTSGMGLSATQAFVAAGAQVVAVGNHETAPGWQHQNAVIRQDDARLENCAPEAIDECMTVFGGFDGLFHVAGGSGRKWGDGPLHELTTEGWLQTFDLNLTALMYSNRAAVQHWLRTKTGGAILNMSSVLGFSPSPQFFTTHAYAAAKAAIIGFSKSVAACYAQDNIRVNVIAPGLMETPMSQRAVQDEQIMAFVRRKQPLDGGRAGQPEDINGLAVYFMSDQSRFTTGQVVAVDGGWTAGS